MASRRTRFSAPFWLTCRFPSDMALTYRAVIVALLGVVPVALFPSWVTMAVWLALVIVAVVVDVALAASPRRVELTRDLERAVRLGETAEVALWLTNHDRKTLRAVVKDAWQPSAGAEGNVARLHIPGGEVRALRYRLTPSRRGDIRASHVAMRSLGPLGVAGRQATIAAPEVLRVLPAFKSKRLLPSKLKLMNEIDSRASVNVRGQGTEFDSLREYVRGDDVRSIDWRATARSREVVVRTWRPERDRRVIIVLDTSRTSAARILDEQRLDTGIEAALLLAALAERGGDRVDFVAFDRRVRSRVRSTMKMATLTSLGAAMSGLTSELVEADWDAIASEVLRLSKQRSFVVFLTALDTGAVLEGLLPVLPMLTARHTVAVASVGDPELEHDTLGGWGTETVDAHGKRRPAGEGSNTQGSVKATVSTAYQAAAADRAVLEQQSLAQMIRQTGAEVVEAPPYELPSALVDLYLRLKAAGRL